MSTSISYPHRPVTLNDIYLIGISMVAFYLLRFLTRSLIFSPLANYVGISTDTAKAGRSSPRQKFLENIWYAIFYPSATCYALFILWDKPWFWNYTDSVVNGMPKVENLPDISRYYLVVIGYYLQLLVNLLFIDEKLDDFIEMLVHHISSLGMLIFSFFFYGHQPGMIILVLHDFVDVFLYAAKTFCMIFCGVYPILFFF